MSRRKRVALLVVGVYACVALMGFVAHAVGTLHREPFRLSLEPADGRTVVRFSQPDRGLVSPDFPVDLEIEAPTVVDLRSGAATIPGSTIEFSDTTMWPGRFRIRVGRTLFDVMERGMIVDGVERDWRPD